MTRQKLIRVTNPCATVVMTPVAQLEARELKTSGRWLHGHPVPWHGDSQLPMHLRLLTAPSWNQQPIFRARMCTALTATQPRSSVRL
jgi:hypothetical protein